MSKKQDLKPIIKVIHQAAIAYKDNLVGKDFLYVFDNRFIEARFRVDNFMHFTGVESTLSARRFYQNALHNKLSPSQIFFSKKHPFDLAQKKWNYICGIPTVLTTECFMLEKITTQTASYEFGTTNLDCTICLNKELVNGVAKGNHYIAMSLRDEDCFNRSQNQFIVTHIFSKSNNSKEYDTLLYMDKEATLCGLPKGIKSQLNSHLQAGEAFVDKCNELFKEVEEIFNENPALHTDFLKLRQNYLNAIGCQPTLPPSRACSH